MASLDIIAITFAAWFDCRAATQGLTSYSCLSNASVLSLVMKCYEFGRICNPRIPCYRRQQWPLGKSQRWLDLPRPSPLGSWKTLTFPEADNVEDEEVWHLVELKGGGDVPMFFCKVQPQLLSKMDQTSRSFNVKCSHQHVVYNRDSVAYLVA